MENAQISELTKEQLDYLPIFRDEYLSHGLSTSEMDFGVVTEVVEEIYEMHHIPKPKIFKCKSPLSANYLINILADGNEERWGHKLCKKLDDLPNDISYDFNDLRKIIGDEKINYIDTYFNGQCDLYWVAHYKFCEYIGVKFPEDISHKLDLMDRLCKNTNFIYFFENAVFVCEKPISIKVNENKVLHSRNSASVEFKDGFKIYTWNGRMIPDYFIENPDKITAKYIQSEENAELRQIALTIYGQERYLKDIKAKKLHEDKYGILHAYTDELLGEIKVVEVVNSTAEPDGTFKRYFLRVPPEMQTAHEAVAWTFNKTAEEYNPDIET